MIGLLAAAIEWSWYGFIISMGILIGTVGAYFAAKKRGYRPDAVVDIIIAAVPLAIIGARTYYVIFDIIGGNNNWTFAEYLGFTGNGFRLEGLAIYGGVIGAILGVYILSLIYRRKEKKTGEKRETFLQLCDIGAPFLILGQAIGRWGNFVNQEVYGQRILNPAYEFFPIAVKVGNHWYQALFFYESILNLIGFGLLLWFFLGRRRSFNGFVISAYGIYYGLARLILEGFRNTDEGDFILYLIPDVLPVSQVVSVLAILAGGAFIIYQIVKAKKKNVKVPILVMFDDWEMTGLPEEVYGKPLKIDEYEYIEEESVDEYLKSQNAGDKQEEIKRETKDK